MQKKSYLGNHADLLAHMKSTGKRKMTTAAVRTWLKNHDTCPVAYKRHGLSLDDCDIDHILPTSVGGIDHPYNYYILPKKLNKRWSGWWTAHKLTYMGANNARSAKDFFLFVMRVTGCRSTTMRLIREGLPRSNAELDRDSCHICWLLHICLFLIR